MYDQMLDMIKHTSEDLESRFESEESKITLEYKGAISKQKNSVISSASKTNSELAKQV